MFLAPSTARSPSCSITPGGMHVIEQWTPSCTNTSRENQVHACIWSFQICRLSSDWTCRLSHMRRRNGQTSISIHPTPIYMVRPLAHDPASPVASEALGLLGNDNESGKALAPSGQTFAWGSAAHMGQVQITIIMFCSFCRCNLSASLLCSIYTYLDHWSYKFKWKGPIIVWSLLNALGIPLIIHWSAKWNLHSIVNLFGPSDDGNINYHDHKSSTSTIGQVLESILE